jgi:hypothetical protein
MMTGSQQIQPNIRASLIRPFAKGRKVAVHAAHSLDFITQPVQQEGHSLDLPQIVLKPRHGYWQPEKFSDGTTFGVDDFRIK